MNSPKLTLVLPEESKPSLFNTKSHSIIYIPKLLSPSFILNHGAITMSAIEMFKKVLMSIGFSQPVLQHPESTPPLCFYRYARLQDLNGTGGRPASKGGLTMLFRYDEFEKKLQVSFAFCHSDERFDKTSGRGMALIKFEQGQIFEVSNVDLTKYSATQAVWDAYLYGVMNGTGGGRYFSKLPNPEVLHKAIKFISLSVTSDVHTIACNRD